MLCKLLFSRLKVSMVRKIVMLGISVMCGEVIMLVWVLFNIRFYFGVGDCVFRLRKDRLVVVMMEVLICMVKYIMMVEMVLGKMCFYMMVVLDVLMLWVVLM